MMRSDRVDPVFMSYVILRACDKVIKANFRMEGDRQILTNLPDDECKDELTNLSIAACDQVLHSGK